MQKIKELFETLSPILINPTSTSLTISLSKRFLLFKILRQVSRKIEDDPYLNFISLLKNYKVLGKFLHGSIRELYRDRNKFYFKNFFMDRWLYRLVKRDLEWLYAINKDIKLTVTKRGIIVYDNYKKNRFNAFLMTIHSGTWMPKATQKKQSLSRKDRLLEEDIDTHKIYGNLVLKKGGIWVDSKFSRFACDYNRSPERAIYNDSSEEWVDHIWKEKLSPAERKWLMGGYHEFYFMLSELIDAYRFNIIFDGHSMKDAGGRPEISFGTKYIPQFYMPIVKGMQHKLLKLGYHSVALNVPYSGGYILKWLNERFPDIFIFSMEVNKKLYMVKDRKKVIANKLEKLAENITEIFDIGNDDFFASLIPPHAQ